MLNRRLLRIKVVQGLYALNRTRLAGYRWGHERLQKQFSPDLNSMETADTEALQQKRKQASVLWKQHLSVHEAEQQEAFPEEVVRAVHTTREWYDEELKKDAANLEKQLEEDIDRLQKEYASLLTFLVALKYKVRQEAEHAAKKRDSEAVPAHTFKFQQNEAVALLEADAGLQRIRENEAVDWGEARDVVNGFYKDTLRQDPEYREYEALGTSNFEKDLEILLHIGKNLLFQDEKIAAHFEERDLRWQENKMILRGMLKRTLKALHADKKPEDPLLMAFSYNWEDDEAYYKTLFRETVKRDRELEQWTSEKLHNWDIERVAVMDNVILKAAVSEMINFPSIPVKVTINEFIDLSKKYSTPKSKLFINGVLDKLAEELQQRGIIKKSGRGLIDNQ